VIVIRRLAILLAALVTTLAVPAATSANLTPTPTDQGSQQLEKYKEIYLAAFRINLAGSLLTSSLNKIAGFHPPCGLTLVPEAYPYMALKDDHKFIYTVFEPMDTAQATSWTEVAPGDFKALVNLYDKELEDHWFHRIELVVENIQAPAKWAMKVHEETHAWEGATDVIGTTWEEWIKEKNSGSLDLSKVKTAICSRTLAVIGLTISENWRALFNDYNHAAHIAVNIGKVTIPAGIWGPSAITIDFSKCQTVDDVAKVLKQALGVDKLDAQLFWKLVTREWNYFTGENYTPQQLQNYIENVYKPHPGGYTHEDVIKAIDLFNSGKDIYGNPLSEDAYAFAILFSIEDVWQTYEEYVHQYGHIFPPSAEDSAMAVNIIKNNMQIIEKDFHAWADIGATELQFENVPTKYTPRIQAWVIGHLFDVIAQLEKGGVPTGSQGQVSVQPSSQYPNVVQVTPVNPLVILLALPLALALARRR